MSLDVVSSTSTTPAKSVSTATSVTLLKTESKKPIAKDTEIAPSAGSTLDAIATHYKGADASKTKFMKAIGVAGSKEELTVIIGENPLEFQGLVNAWAKANGITGKDQGDLVGMFLNRLKSDLGFDTSNHGVSDKHLIQLEGADARLTATVSTVGQLIFEKYGEAAFKEFRGKVEKEWAAKGELGDEITIVMDDVVSSASEGAAKYDASGKLTTPSPDARIAQLYIELGKKDGSISPDKVYNDYDAQMQFFTGEDSAPIKSANQKTPVTDLLRNIQIWQPLDQAYKENQSQFDAGKITKDQYLKTESVLAALMKEPREAIRDAALASGSNLDLVLRGGTAQGVIYALAEPATAQKIEQLGAAREKLAKLNADLGAFMKVESSVAHPRTQTLMAAIRQTKADIAKLENDLKAKGIDTSDKPFDVLGDGFDGIRAGVQMVREEGLDKAFSAEQAAQKKASQPTVTSLLEKADRLAEKRAELKELLGDKKSGDALRGPAAAKFDKLTAEIAALESELTPSNKNSKLPADTFTNPLKALGFKAATQNENVAALFETWQQKSAELAALNAELAKAKPDAGNDPELAGKRAKAAGLAEDLDKLSQDIHAALYGVDADTAKALETARAERDAARDEISRLAEVEGSQAEFDAARATWNEKDKAVDALEAKLQPPPQWKNEIAVVAQGASTAAKTDATVNWRKESDPAYAAGYTHYDALTDTQRAALESLYKSLEERLGDKFISAEDREALVKQFKEVAALLPKNFLGTDNPAAPLTGDGDWDLLFIRVRQNLGSFLDGRAQRAVEIQEAREKRVLETSPETHLESLRETAGDTQKGQTATAQLTYVQKTMGVGLSQDDLTAFLNDKPVPKAQEKVLLIAAKFFAENQGLKLDDASALKVLKTALKADGGLATSDYQVDKWEEFTFAGTDDPKKGPATPETELLRSTLSVLHEIYADVFGEEAAAALDKKVEPRFYDGVIVPEYKEVTGRGGTKSLFSHYRLPSGKLDEKTGEFVQYWDEKTGEILVFKDKPWFRVEWDLKVVLRKDVTYRGRGGPNTIPEFKYVTPENQEEIKKLQAEGFKIERVEAKPASEPQLMLGRLIEGFYKYMETYKPVYDKDGNITNPPPIARIAQYYVQTQLVAERSDPDDPESKLESYKIIHTGQIMSDADAIRTMLTDLGMSSADIDVLFGIGSKQMNESSTLFKPGTNTERIVNQVMADVFTFGLASLIDGLIDRNTVDPLTDFGRDRLGDWGRDQWRSLNRDKMDDPGVFDLVFEPLFFAVADLATGGVAGAIGRGGRTGAKIANATVDATTDAATSGGVKSAGTAGRAGDDIASATVDATTGAVGTGGQTGGKVANNAIDATTDSADTRTYWDAVDAKSPPAGEKAGKKDDIFGEAFGNGSTDDMITTQVYPTGTHAAGNPVQESYPMFQQPGKTVTGTVVPEQPTVENATVHTQGPADGPGQQLDQAGTPGASSSGTGDTVQPKPEGFEGPGDNAAVSDAPIEQPKKPAGEEKAEGGEKSLDEGESSGKEAQPKETNKGTGHSEIKEGPIEEETPGNPPSSIPPSSSTGTGKGTDESVGSGKPKGKDADPPGAKPSVESPAGKPIPEIDTASPPDPATAKTFRWQPGLTVDTQPIEVDAAIRRTVADHAEYPHVKTIKFGDAGEAQNYVKMKGPDGHEVYVKVAKVEVDGADQPDKWYIDSPAKGDADIQSMPEVAINPETNLWQLKDSLALRAYDFDKKAVAGKFDLSDSNFFVSLKGPEAKTSSAKPSWLNNPLDALRNTAANIYIRGKWSSEPAPLIEKVFELDDPKVLLGKYAEAHVRSDPGGVAQFVRVFDNTKKEYNTIKKNHDIEITKQQDLEVTRDRLEVLKSSNPKMTWKDIEDTNEDFVGAMVRQNIAKTDTTGPGPDTSIDVLIGDIDSKLAKSRDLTEKQSEKMLGLYNSVLDEVKKLDGAGRDDHRNSVKHHAIKVAVGVGITTAVTVPAGLAIQDRIRKNNQRDKDPFNREVTVSIGKNSTQELDVATVSGTKNKGYKYKMPSDFLQKNGAQLDESTGKLTLSTNPTSKIGDKDVISVQVLDRNDKLKGTLKITVAVDDAGNTAPKLKVPVDIALDKDGAGSQKLSDLIQGGTGSDVKYTLAKTGGEDDKKLDKVFIEDGVLKVDKGSKFNKDDKISVNVFDQAGVQLGIIVFTVKK